MQTFTLIHVLISLIGIAAGLIVVYGMLTGKGLPGLTLTFLVFTVLTSVTGFFFPFHGVTPGIIVGIVSLIVLCPTMVALYRFRLAGVWRPVYVIGAVIALWFNVFVLIAQAFQKIPALHALAPTGSEPPFGAAQGIVLILFVVLGFLSLRRFHPVAA